MKGFTVLLAGTILLNGCYTYRPLGNAQPLAGTRVSAELTNDGAHELSGQLGPQVEHVEGDVLAVDSNGVQLAVRQVETTRGYQVDWKGEKVLIPRAAVSGWQQHRLSVGGTSLMGGLLVGVLYGMYTLLGGAGELEGNGGSGGSSGPH
jgi:hypothetical protein